MDNTICVTMDMDWAPDEVIKYSLDFLVKYKIKATLFMTHKLGIKTDPHEIGIHPHYTSLDYETHIAERLNKFPGVRGIRSHSLFFTERLRPYYLKYGICYDSNVMMYRQHYAKPYYIDIDTVEIPLFWMDTFHIEMANDFPVYDLAELNISEKGLKVFNFHPVHVYLNTNSLVKYIASKQYYHDPKNLAKHRNTSQMGTKDFFVELLKHVSEKGLKTMTLGEVNEQYRISVPEVQAC